MEKITIANTLTVFGKQVNTFPNGIAEAFDELMDVLPNGRQRPYYGISQCTTKGIEYHVAAAEDFAGEGKNYGYQNYTIEKGEYLTKTVFNWLSKTSSIKNVFEEMMQCDQADPSKPCIELYKDDNEMVCMVKVSEQKALLAEFDEATNQFYQLLSLLNQQQVNMLPFAGSWTAAQVANHIALSNAGFATLLNGALAETERAHDEKVPEIRTAFLDFSIKMSSPEFVWPKNRLYDKAELLQSLAATKDLMIKAIKAGNFEKTCISFELPVAGYLTRLEAIHFVVCHNIRHLHQLRTIYPIVSVL